MIELFDLPKKIVSYDLTISPKFLANHPRAGEPTLFYEKIANGEKIHTIRGGFENWKKKILRVQKGEAVISVTRWSGYPYRSKKIKIFEIDNTSGIGIEPLLHNDFNRQAEVGNSIVDWHEIAKNDGLSFFDFQNWFKEPIKEVAAIIHFTSFRYE